MGNDMTAHLTTAALVTYGLEWVKGQGWFPWVDQNTKTLNRCINAVLAAAIALGINWQFDVTAGTLVVTGLTKQAMLHGAYEFAKQLMAQQAIYDGIVAKKG